MKGIKFRGWDKEKKKMYYFGLLEYMSINEDAQDRRCSYSARQNELMQYIGLKDKYDKEIYEGDIVKRGNEIFGQIFEVKIDAIEVNIPQLGNSVTIKTTILFDRKTNYKEVMYFKQMSISTEKDVEYEIIGNIYEDNMLE